MKGKPDTRLSCDPAVRFEGNWVETHDLGNKVQPFRRTSKRPPAA